jgi:raffinose/stachyose/melibiose transport system substrate-binding protein
MKRTMVMLIAALVASVASVASVAFAQTAQAPLTLSIIANQDWVTKPYMKAAWANYEKVSGNKLDIQALPIDNWETVMKTRAAAGELPDIVMTFAGPVLDAMRPAENFFDLSKEPLVKDLKPFVLPQVTYKGKIYGLPLWEGSVSGDRKSVV